VECPLAAAALVAGGIAVLAWQQLAAELARGFGDLKTASFFSGGNSGGPLSNVLFVAALVAVWAVGASAGLLMVTGLLVASIAVTCPLAWAGVSQMLRPRSPTTSRAVLTTEQRRALLFTGLALLANQALAFLSQQTDLWIAGAVLAGEDVGLFGAAKRAVLLAAMPVQMATMTVVASLPRLYAQSRLGELEATVRTAATAAAVPGLMAVAAMALVPATTLGSVFGEAYAHGSGALVALLGGYVVLIVSGNPQHVLIMTGRHRAVFAVNLVSALVLVLAGVVLARLWGIVGLAAATSASLTLQNVALWWVAHRELGVWTHIGWRSLPVEHTRQGMTENIDIAPTSPIL
jgi:O-antigen/teichoic acid export membrane protein